MSTEIFARESSEVFSRKNLVLISVKLNKMLLIILKHYPLIQSFCFPGGGRLEEELNFLSRIDNLSFDKSRGETGLGGAYQVSSQFHFRFFVLLAPLVN